MKTHNYTIHYVGTGMFSTRYLLGDSLVSIEAISSITNVFPLLSDAKFCSDLIIIDVDELCSIKHSDAFSIIDTLSTIISCTVCRLSDTEKPVQRTTKIAVACNLTSNVNIIKELLGTNVTGFYPIGPDFTLEEKRVAISELLNGDFYIPKQIKQLISPSKQKLEVDDNQIVLTPRQSQIKVLIQERGVSNKVIAKMLHISESTVKLHLTHIFKKYGVRNRTQLALCPKEKH